MPPKELHKKRLRGRPLGSRAKDNWDADNALAILHQIANENQEARRGQVLRLAAEQLYPIMYGPDDFETARSKVRTETDKDCLRARIDALYRRIEREQAAIDHLYMLAVEDAYETCHDVEHIVGDEVYTDNDVEQYYELLAAADQLYCVLPQGLHPSLDSGGRIKSRQNKAKQES